MKKITIMFLVSFLLLIFSCTTAEKLVMTDLYSIDKHQVTDIRGNFDVNSFLLYKDITFSGNFAVTINKYIEEGKNASYSVQLYYTGTGWLFINKIFIKTDEKLYELEDHNPSRDVLNKGVTETVSCLLSPEIISSISNTSKLSIQYSKPVEIPNKGVQLLKDFIK